jgi:hypothetical protein
MEPSRRRSRLARIGNAISVTDQAVIRCKITEWVIAGILRGAPPLRRIVWPAVEEWVAADWSAAVHHDTAAASSILRGARYAKKLLMSGGHHT